MINSHLIWKCGKSINVCDTIIRKRCEVTSFNYSLTFIISLMNHTTFGFGTRCDIKISEEEETIVSMCLLLIGSACGFHSWCEWDDGHKTHLKRAARPSAKPQKAADCYQPHALNKAQCHRSKTAD